jgi:hypothetical protein
VPATLTPREHELKAEFVQAVEALMLELDAQAVERIAEHVAESGTDGDGGAIEDATVFDCLELIVHNMRLK